MVDESQHLSEEYKASLKHELKIILGKSWLFGHRGMNNPNNPEEVRRAQELTDRFNVAIIRANEIAFILKAAELGKNPDDYELVGIVEKGKGITEDIGYHPDDITINILHKKAFSNTISEITSHVTVHRKIGTLPVSDISAIWNSSLEWVKIANENSKIIREVLNPLAYLFNIHHSHSQLGRNVARLNTAIKELYTVLGLEVPEEYKNSTSVEVADELTSQSVKSDKPIETIQVKKYPSELWDKTMGWKWLTIVSEFGKWPKNVNDPIAVLEEIRQSQISLGRKTDRYDEAIAEISTYLNSN